MKDTLEIVHKNVTVLMENVARKRVNAFAQWVGKVRLKLDQNC